MFCKLKDHKILQLNAQWLSTILWWCYNRRPTVDDVSILPFLSFDIGIDHISKLGSYSILFSSIHHGNVNWTIVPIPLNAKIHSPKLPWALKQWVNFWKKTHNFSTYQEGFLMSMLVFGVDSYMGITHFFGSTTRIGVARLVWPSSCVS